MMRFATRITLAVVPLVLFAAPASVAWADTCYDPTGGTFYSAPVSADGAQRIFAGKAKPFGPIIGSLTLQRIDPITGTFSGIFTIQNNRGTAYGILEGHYTSANTYEETLTFLGGTGKY